MAPTKQLLARLTVLGLRASTSDAFFVHPFSKMPLNLFQTRSIVGLATAPQSVAPSKISWRRNPALGVLGARAESGLPPPKDASADSIFCKIIRKEIPAKVVYEDDKCLAFKDVAPTAPIHMLVIPKQKITQLSKTKTELGTTDEVKALLGHMLMVAADIGKEHSPNGFRCVINDGKEGCQTVYRLHIHVIGGKQLGWPPTGN